MHTGFQFCHDAAAHYHLLNSTPCSDPRQHQLDCDTRETGREQEAVSESERERKGGGMRRPNNKFERVQAHATLPPCPLFSTPLPQPFFSPATPLAPPLASTALWWQPLYNYLKLKLTVERVGKDYAHRIESQRVASHRITVDRAIDRHSGTHCRFCMLMCRSRELQRDAACANLLRVNIGSKKE